MKIPATVITGFLGAGKTTLIRHLLANAGGKRLALIIHDFGDLGIDAGIIEGCAIDGCADGDIIELANGCICCTVADDFLPTMEILLGRDTPPDHIVIETSGLALPKPLVKAFNWPEIRTRTTVDGVIAVIDAPAVRDGQFADDPDAVQARREADPMLDHDNPLEEVFTDQLTAADIVLLNKTDLLGAGELAAVEADLESRVRPGTKIVAISHGRVAPAVILGLGAAAEDDLAARPSLHDAAGEHDHDDFQSFRLPLGPIDDIEALERRLLTAIEGHAILRLKGFIDIPGKEMRHVIQAVGARLERYFDRPWKAGERRLSEVVIIGLAGLDEAAIRAAITG